MHGDWVVAIASIIAAIVGGVVIFFVERLRATKKRIQFLISEPQTITGDLHAHGREFKVTLGEQSASELNVSVVSVTNSGNTPIESLTFDVTIPGGERRIMLAECMTSNETLRKAVAISFSDPHPPSESSVYNSTWFLQLKGDFQHQNVG